MTTSETTTSLSKPMRSSVRQATMLTVIVLHLLVSPVRVSATDLVKTPSAVRADEKQVRKAQEWIKVEGPKKEIPVQLVYPLKSLKDLKNVLFVAVHPFNFVGDLKDNWGRIFGDYNVQFLDRGTAHNDVNVRDGLDVQNVNFTKGRKIPIASYFFLHPYHPSEDYSFLNNYYTPLPKEEKWKNFSGAMIEDPYEWAGAKDVFGKVIKIEEGKRIIMSLNSYDWFNYQVISAKYVIDSGVDAIDMDLMMIMPLLCKGDFSNWCIREFHRYLESRFTGAELKGMEPTDVSHFDIQKYIVDGHVKRAVKTISLIDGSEIFITEPFYQPIEDPILREFIKFSYYTLIEFHGRLSSEIKKYGLERGLVIPYFGNLIVGHPSFILSTSNNSILLGQVVDIVQLETRPAVPPKERVIISYKIGWAMSKGEKPIWSLHQPFYGFPDEVKIDLNSPLVGLNQLYIAESYAAGVVPEIDLGGWPGMKGGAGLFVSKDGQVYPQLEKYLNFVLNNQEYFKNVEPYSKIGLVYSVPSFMWRNFPLFGIWYDELRKPFVGYARALEEAHLQYDVLIFGMPGFYDDSKTLKELANYDVLILPNVYSVTNEQFQALDSFVRKGRKLIYIGRDALSRDEEYRERDKASILRILGGKPTHVFFRDEKCVIRFHDNTYEKGIKDVTNFNRLVSAITYKFEKLIETNAPREVGVNVLKQKDKLIIHFINYDYDLQSDSFRVRRDIEFKLGDKLPIKEIKKISLISPDFDETMYIEKPSGRSFVMPELKIWNAVIVE